MKREVEWLIQKEYETAIIGEEYEMSYVASVKKRRLSNSVSIIIYLYYKNRQNFFKLLISVLGSRKKFTE